MMNSSIRSIARSGLVLSLALAVGACATVGGGKGGPAQSLESRVLARWDGLIQRKAEESWPFLTPGYRQTTPQTEYAQRMNNRPVRWVEASVRSSACSSEDVCDVTVDLVIDVPAPARPGQRVQAKAAVVEKWLRIDGTWYHLPKEAA